MTSINNDVNMPNMSSAALKSKHIVKKLLSVLPDRARNVITHRYGLGDEVGEDARKTLEAIGEMYGITRERVRQIENYALQTIRKSDVFASEAEAFQKLQNAIEELGGIVAEEELLESLAKDKRAQNDVYLLLVLGDSFTRGKESEALKHHWVTDSELAEAVNTALVNLTEGLTEDDLVAENELLAEFSKLISKVSEKHKQREDIQRRWLSLSKLLNCNPLGEWGLASSPNIRVKGMRDYAYLAIRRHGSPMHFTEVAKSINDLFGKNAHVATCHNELIKDNRFILVGRGLYALSEWGYVGGVVRDVIGQILKKDGPLSKNDIIDKVLKERYVKENTITVNLENTDYFNKDSSGRYFTSQSS